MNKGNERFQKIAHAIKNFHGNRETKITKNQLKKILRRLEKLQDRIWVLRELEKDVDIMRKHLIRIQDEVTKIYLDRTIERCEKYNLIIGEYIAILIEVQGKATYWSNDYKVTQEVGKYTNDFISYKKSILQDYQESCVKVGVPPLEDF